MGNKPAGQWQRPVLRLGPRQKKRCDGVDSQGHSEGVGQVCAGSVDDAMGEVKEFDGAVDDGEAQGD